MTLQTRTKATAAVIRKERGKYLQSAFASAAANVELDICGNLGFVFPAISLYIYCFQTYTVAKCSGMFKRKSDALSFPSSLSWKDQIPWLCKGKRIDMMDCTQFKMWTVKQNTFSEIYLWDEFLQKLAMFQGWRGIHMHLLQLKLAKKHFLFL